MAKLLSWDQDVTTVYARFTVPKGTRASQVRVDAAVNSLLVFVLPSDSTLSYVYEGQKEGGELSKTIISADVLWTLEEDDGGRRVVHVVLPKSTTGQPSDAHPRWRFSASSTTAKSASACSMVRSRSPSGANMFAGRLRP